MVGVAQQNNASRRTLISERIHGLGIARVRDDQIRSIQIFLNECAGNRAR